MYVCGITRLRPLPHRPRAHAGRVRRHRPPPARQRLRRPLRPQRHRHRRQDHPRAHAEGRSAARGRARVHRGDQRRHARAGRRARRRRAARHRAHRRDDRRSSSAWSTQRPGLRRRAATSTTRSTASPRYGKLSGQSIDELKAGARIEVDERKRSPLDFALWKGAKPGEPRGSPRGARAVPAGTSSARRWRHAISARRSTSTAAART